MAPPRPRWKAVGAALVELEYFRPDQFVTVEVTIDHGRHVVAFVTRGSVFSDEKIQRAFREVASVLSAKVFANQPVDINLVDGDLDPHVKLSWESRPR